MRQVQAGPHPQPHARRRRRDRVVDVAAVAEGHVARRHALAAARRATAPSAPVRGPARLASSRALTAVVLETMSIAALAIGAPSVVRSRPRTTCAAPEPADEQRPAPPPAPMRGQPREVARPIAVRRAPQRRIRPGPDRLARGDRPRDRPEDRCPIARGILEQHAHDCAGPAAACDVSMSSDPLSIRSGHGCAAAYSGRSGRARCRGTSPRIAQRHRRAHRRRRPRPPRETRPPPMSAALRPKCIDASTTSARRSRRP